MSDISNSDASLTKEQLLACIEHDGVEVDADKINKAKKNDGAALYSIGYAYKSQKINHSKAMAWYQLSLNQNYSFAYNNIGVLYGKGFGVTQDYHTAIEYYLKAAGNNNNNAMSNIGNRFFNGRGFPVDKYKALEWFIKCGIIPEQVEKLNKQGFHLKEEDKKKTIHQLIIETENIIREERKKKDLEYQELKKLKLSNQKELRNQRNEIQKLQSELQQEKQEKQQGVNDRESLKQSNSNLENQLKDKDEIINSLKREKQQGISDRESLKKSNSNVEKQLKDKEEIIKLLNREYETSKKASELFELLVQSKNNEIDLLKRDNQRLGNLEQENHDLKRRLEGHQEPTSSMNSNNSTNDSNNSDTASDSTRHNNLNDNIQACNPIVNNTRVKTEENEPIPCEIGNKKRKVA